MLVVSYQGPCEYMKLDHCSVQLVLASLLAVLLLSSDWEMAQVGRRLTLRDGGSETCTSPSTWNRIKTVSNPLFSSWNGDFLFDRFQKRFM